MTTAGPRTAQQRLQVLDKRIEQIAVRLDAFAAAEERLQINQDQQRSTLVNQDQQRSTLGRRPPSGPEVPKIGGGWPGNGGHRRPSPDEGSKPRPSRQPIGNFEPPKPKEPNIVRPDPEIITDFDRIAREHLLVWLAGSLVILSITIGLPYVIVLL